MEEVELVSVSAREENGVQSLNEASDVDSESDLIARPSETRGKSSLSVKFKSLLKLEKSKNTDESGSGEISLKRELTYLSGVAYVVGSIIGSGIFITPNTILCQTGSFGLSMIVWVIGGMVAIAGGLCYIELGLLIRQSGGDYSYIKETYSFKKSNNFVKVLGPLLAFLFIWSSVCVIRASSLAILTLTCAQYLIQPFFMDCENVPVSAVKLLTFSILITICLINCYSLKLASKVMVVFTVLKVLSVVFIVLVGVIFMIKRQSVPENFKHPFTTIQGLEIGVPSVTLSLYSVLWAYSGWDVMGYAVEETKNLKRNLPLIVLTGIPIVIVCYLLVNLSFFAILSPDQILNSKAVALPFGKYTLGTAGVVMVLILVSSSTFGTANASLFVGSRIIFVAAREGELPGFLSGLHTSARTPIPAILLQVFLSLLMVSAGTIDQLIQGFTFVSFIFYTLSIVAVLILRVSHRKEFRIYKVWFIVPVTVVLACFCVFLLFVPLLSAPLPPLIALGFVMLGVPAYFILVMDNPWRIRPKIMDRISVYVAGVVNKLLNTRSTRQELQQPRSPS